MQSGKIPDSADYAVRLLGTDGRDLLFELMADEGLGLTASIPKEAYDLFAGELHAQPDSRGPTVLRQSQLDPQRL